MVRMACRHRRLGGQVNEAPEPGDEVDSTEQLGELLGLRVLLGHQISVPAGIPIVNPDVIPGSVRPVSSSFRPGSSIWNEIPPCAAARYATINARRAAAGASHLFMTGNTHSPKPQTGRCSAWQRYQRGGRSDRHPPRK
jgi:hypothetical protein